MVSKGGRLLFLERCKENSKTNYTQKIDRSLLAWSGSKEPTGGWSKGALTTTLCQFIEAFTKSHNLESSHDECFRLIVARSPWTCFVVWSCPVICAVFL